MLAKLLDFLNGLIDLFKQHKLEESRAAIERQARDQAELEQRRAADKIEQRAEQIDAESRTVPVADLADRMRRYRREKPPTSSVP